MKKKIFIVVLIFIGIILTVGIVYSAFSSPADLSTKDQKVAKFIFEAKQQEQVEIPLSSLKPGAKEEYLFSVTNTNNLKVSNVTINYQIIVKTFHYMPLEIRLFKGNATDAILICDESYSRDEDNVLICNSPVQELKHNEKGIDSYKLEVNFPKNFNSEEYSDLVDFIDLEIKSWQKKAK